MECLCPPPPPTRLWNPTPCLFSRALVPALRLPSISPSLPLFYSLPSPSVTSPFPPPTPTPVIRSRGFHMKMTYLTGHISMCHSASDATLQIFWRGSAPILLFFFSFFFTLTAPPLPSNTTRFCIPVLNEKKKRQRGRQTDRWRDWEGGFRKERHGQWTLV